MQTHSQCHAGERENKVTAKRDDKNDLSTRDCVCLQKRVGILNEIGFF